MHEAVRTGISFYPLTIHAANAQISTEMAVSVPQVLYVMVHRLHWRSLISDCLWISSAVLQPCFPGVVWETINNEEEHNKKEQHTHQHLTSRGRRPREHSPHQNSQHCFPCPGHVHRITVIQESSWGAGELTPN